MNILRHIPQWLTSPAILLVIAAFFKFCMRGYDYMAYTFAFFAALLIIRHFAPEGLWRAVLILVSLGLMYFCAVEIPIIKNSFTDKDACHTLPHDCDSFHYCRIHMLPPIIKRRNQG